jgi:hypothetical protein
MFPLHSFQLWHKTWSFQDFSNVTHFTLHWLSWIYAHKTVFCSQMIQSDNTLPAGVKSETCQQYLWPTVTYWQTIKATPQPSWLVTGFSLQVHICAKEAHMGFVVEKEALGQAFLKSPSVFPSILFPPTPYCLIHRLRQMKKSCSFHPIKTCWQYLPMVCGSHSLA